MQVIPDTLFTKLRNIDVLSFAGGSVPAVAGESSIIRVYLNAGNLTAPFAPFSTDSPIGLEQWQQFYLQYVIHKSSLAVTPVTVSSTFGVSNGLLPYQITIVPLSDDQATALDNDYPFDEQPYSRNRQFNAIGTLITSLAGPPLEDIYNAQYGNNTKSSVYNTMMTKKMRVLTNLVDDVDSRGTLSNPITTPPNTPSPANTYIWAIEVKSLVPWDGVSPVDSFTLGNFQARVTMVHNVQFIRRVPVLDTSEV